MYDAVFVLVEAFNKILRKKPDQFRNNVQRRSQTLMAAASTAGDGSNSSSNNDAGFNSNSGSGSGSSGSFGIAPRALDCNTAKGWVNAWEHGDMVKRISNVSMAIEFLHTLEQIGRFTKKHIVLDCPTEMAKQILIQHVRDLRLGRRTYHYLLSGLVSWLLSKRKGKPLATLSSSPSPLHCISTQVMDDRWESEIIEFGAINITGFRIVDTNRRLVREFYDSWKRLDPQMSVGAGRESISVKVL